jgi:hypothetical protein
MTNFRQLFRNAKISGDLLSSSSSSITSSQHENEYKKIANQIKVTGKDSSHRDQIYKVRLSSNNVIYTDQYKERLARIVDGFYVSLKNKIIDFKS